LSGVRNSAVPKDQPNFGGLNFHGQEFATTRAQLDRWQAAHLAKNKACKSFVKATNRYINEKKFEPRNIVAELRRSSASLSLSHSLSLSLCSHLAQFANPLGLGGFLVVGALARAPQLWRGVPQHKSARVGVKLEARVEGRAPAAALLRHRPHFGDLVQRNGAHGGNAFRRLEVLQRLKTCKNSGVERQKETVARGYSVVDGVEGASS